MIGLGGADYGWICADCHEFIQYGQCHDDCEGFDEGSAPPYPRGYRNEITLEERVAEISRTLEKILELLEEKA